MTPYTKLKDHLDRHAYKRGVFRGDAPADSSRRYKNHFRVVRGNGGQMCVRMYNTDLISVTEDNLITINMDGWHTSTTIANLSQAMWRFIGWGGVGSLRYRGFSQLAVGVNGKRYRYYDGMEFSAEGELLSPAKPFSCKRTDRDGTAEFRKDIEESGFKAVWPVLFAAAEPDRWASAPYGFRKTVTQECYAHHWPNIAAQMKFHHDDHKEAYRSIVAQCTQDMKEVVDTDVTVL